MGWMCGNDNDSEETAWGDEVWDLLDDFINDVRNVYLRSWGRLPNEKELNIIIEELKENLTREFPLKYEGDDLEWGTEGKQD
jgi:hypothetical protein